ncbi:Abi family protein [Neisseria sp. ZJ106]|uniref:Abi family protein n=1 Tax=Neisseria lisongii TaxID=2912188 RepID=A0ABY7RI37_9NEIS|nr:Abi family protein [Neisseria lisongii]MCF7520877.1 Abi family protein [Neisseria lisongii]WCL71314.1 Abi family protein [Neisseria lisongii]
MDNRKPLKTWLDFDQQLELLKTRGLHIENENRAKQYLQRIGYYRLSGYFYPFREFNPENTFSRLNTFQKGSTFETVLALYIFDKKLRLMALDALERIEMAIRVDVAYTLGKRSSDAHQNSSCLHGNFVRPQSNGSQSKHQKWLEKYEGLVSRARKQDFVRHNLEKYGCLPIWAACEILDFGALSMLFSGMKYEDKQIIARKYHVQNHNEMEQWLRSLNFIRNVSAHHSRLWNTNITERANLSANFPQDPYWSQLKNDRAFAYFCVMQKMLTVICPHSSWSKRFDALMETFPKNPIINLHMFGLPENWQLWDLWEKPQPDNIVK